MFIRYHFVGYGVIMLALLFSLTAPADTLILRGGEKLIGKVLAEEPSKVIFESQTLGKVEVARERIERLERDPVPSPPAVSTTNNVPPATLGLALSNQFLPWTSGAPGADAFDWIQLKSGEWLAGKIKSMQEEKLEFDSEELNLLTFDWKDIRMARSARLNSVRIEKLKPMDGSLLVTRSEVQVTTPTATNTYPRTDLLAITPTGDRELDKWSAKVSVGASFRSGNTREVDINGRATLQRRTPDTRLKLDYEANYGKVSGEQTEQNQRFIGQFDYFLSRRLYVRLPDVEYFRDPVQNLDHRLTLGAGVGYDLIKTPRTEWNATVSPSWQRNWFHSVNSGDPTADSAALVLSTHFNTELTKRLDFIFEYRGQLTSKENGNDTHHAETTLEFEIHKRLKLDLSFVWDRIGDPKPEMGGDQPKRDDFRLITSLGIDF